MKNEKETRKFAQNSKFEQREQEEQQERILYMNIYIIAY